MAKKAAEAQAAKRPPYRLKDISDEQMSALQRALRDAIYSGPRGIRKKLTGPFQIWLNAPELGHLAQALGAHVRYKTSLSPRLSETAILVTAQIWKAHYEWFAHAPHGREGRREAADHQGHPGRARAEVGGEGRAGDHRFRQGDVQDPARQRQNLQARARLPRRRRRGRAGRHLRLLRDDLDDAQRVPRADSGGRGAAVRRAGR